MTAPTGAGQVAVLPSQRDGFGRSQGREVHAGVKRHQPLATGVRPAALLADIGDSDQQRPCLAGVHHNAPVDDLGDLRRLPLQPVQRIGRQLFPFDGVAQDAARRYAMAYGHSRLNPAESRRWGQLSRETGQASAHGGSAQLRIP